MTMRSEAVDATAPVDVARIGVATSETDFTTSEAAFATALGELRLRFRGHAFSAGAPTSRESSRVIVLHSFAA